MTAQSAAQRLRPADTVFIWKSGGLKYGGGLIAKVKVTKIPYRAVGAAPWPNPSDYTWLIPIEVFDELEEPIPDTFPGHREGVRFRVQNTDLQKGLQELNIESANRFEACFT